LDFPDFLDLQTQLFPGFANGGFAIKLARTQVAAYALPVERVHVFLRAALLQEEATVWMEDEQVDSAVEQVVAVDHIAPLRADFIIIPVNDGEELGGVGVVSGHEKMELKANA
jgi:hypothetical protein